MGKKVMKSKTVSDQLRAAIKASGLTHYALAKLAGTVPQVIDRFVGGKELRSDTIDKLCAALGLELMHKNPGNR